MLLSIIIRTLNEEIHLNDLLVAIKLQDRQNFDIEVIVVDSGSTDKTLAIAQSHDCRIVHISRREFSFGRSLNMGCEIAAGEILILISGHCVPIGEYWLQRLCQPLLQNQASYVYGRQTGGEDSRYSECRIFAKHYPAQSQIPQVGFYCNNANAAIKHITWKQYGFDEKLTGLEDMQLAKQLVKDERKMAYVAEANVFHYHNETWNEVKLRFERESIALQVIMPQFYIGKWDLIRYIFSGVCLDWRHAWREKVFFKKAVEIAQYRLFQYWGSYIGNHDHRKLSHMQKEEYFFPK